MTTIKKRHISTAIRVPLELAMFGFMAWMLLDVEGAVWGVAACICGAVMSVSQGYMEYRYIKLQADYLELEVSHRLAKVAVKLMGGKLDIKHVHKVTKPSRIPLHEELSFPFDEEEH